MIEFRIGDINAFSIQDIHGTITDRSCHSKRHGNAVIDSYLDHRIAMSFAVAALACGGSCEIEGGECVNISYPEFYEDLYRLGE